MHDANLFLTWPLTSFVKPSPTRVEPAIPPEMGSLLATSADSLHATSVDSLHATSADFQNERTLATGLHKTWRPLQNEAMQALDLSFYWMHDASERG